MSHPQREGPTLPPADSAPTLTARDIMTPAPRTCTLFSTVLEAVLIFRDADCGVVPILDEGKPVGVLTDRDVALALPEYADLAAQPVSAIMTRGSISVLPDTPINVVKDKFGEHGVRRVLVVDSNDQLHGIIAWADIAPPFNERTVGQVVSDVVEQP